MPDSVPVPTPDTAAPEPVRDEFEDYLNDALKDPRFASAYEDAGIHADLLRDLIVQRRRSGLSQTDVASYMETTQSAVSDLEGGGTDPRLSTLQRYARAVGMKLVIALRPDRGSDAGR